MNPKFVDDSTSHGIHNQNNNSTIFCGDLSIFCTENDLYENFKSFGSIHTIKIMRSRGNNSSLCYGFIRFNDQHVAETALHEMSGVSVSGRKLRLNWATESKSFSSPQFEVSVYLKFSSTRWSEIKQYSFNEDFIQQLFSQFGLVTQVCIRRCSTGKDFKTMSGYAFIHFEANQQGIDSAIVAAKHFSHLSINDVLYQCTLSNILYQHLNGPSDDSQSPETVSQMISTSSDFHTVGSTSSSSRGSNNRPNYSFVSQSQMYTPYVAMPEWTMRTHNELRWIPHGNIFDDLDVRRYDLQNQVNPMYAVVHPIMSVNHNSSNQQQMNPPMGPIVNNQYMQNNTDLIVRHNSHVESGTPTYAVLPNPSIMPPSFTLPVQQSFGPVQYSINDRPLYTTYPSAQYFTSIPNTAFAPHLNSSHHSYNRNQHLSTPFAQFPLGTKSHDSTIQTHHIEGIPMWHKYLIPAWASLWLVLMI
eukprot:gene13160-17629_t